MHVNNLCGIFLVMKNITYSNHLKCYSVKTEILPDGAQSRLFVANAKPTDSGNYTCSLADVAATYVSVQVLNGWYSEFGKFAVEINSIQFDNILS